MRVKPHIVVRRVKLLQDPDATHVSLVDHGANQTPWTIVKRALPLTKSSQPSGATMPLKLRRPVTAKAAPVKKTEGQEETSNLAILKVVFPVTAYKTEAAVTKYLTDNGYEDFTVVKDKDGKTFTAKSSTVAADAVENVKTVKAEGDIVAHVGTLKAVEEETEETTETTEKAEGEGDEPSALMRKFTWYDAYYDDSKSPIDILKAGMKDGLPPGMDEVMFAVTRAVANTIKDGGDDVDSTLDKLGDDMVKLVKGLYTLYSTIDTDEAKKAIKGLKADSEVGQSILKFVTDMNDFIEKSAGDIDENAPVEAAAEEQGEEQGEAVVEEPSKPAVKGKLQTSAKAPTAPAVKTPAAPDLGALLTKALSPFTTKLDAIGKDVAAVKGSTETLDGRMKKLENRAPTKKSDAAASETQPNEDNTSKAAAADVNRINKMALAGAICV